MKGKHYSRYLLRALDGEDLRLDAELKGMVVLAGRVRSAVPAVPALAGDARARIWDGAVSRTTEPVAVKGGGLRIPRTAWLAAGGAALALAVFLVLALVLFGGGPAPQPAELARLRVLRGDVRIVSPQGDERAGRDGDVLMEGDTLVAAEAARGEVEFESGSLARLDGGTKISISREDGGIAVEVERGRTYHRVLGGSPYTARSDGVTATARGTAFTFDVGEDYRAVLALQSSLLVEVDTESLPGWSGALEEGGALLYREGGAEADVSGITRESLDDEWLRWNRSRDEGLGLPLGALALLEEEAAGEEPAPPAEEPEQPPAPAPQPAPAPAPTPAPAPSPAPTPEPEARSVVLSGVAREGVAEFSWTVSGYSGFQGFKLCRSQNSAAPSYPDDWWKYIDGENARYATDGTVAAGQTYYYRLAVYDQGSVLGYSNAVRLTVPGQAEGLSITLSASVAGGRVELNWSVSGSGSYSGFKVCRSETNAAPSYPDDNCTYVDASQRSFQDSSVVPGHTYYYRVGIYRDGAIVKYSNAVKV